MNAPAAPPEDTDGDFDTIALLKAYRQAICIKSTLIDWFQMVDDQAHTARLTASHAGSHLLTVRRASVEPPPIVPKVRDAARLIALIVVSLGIATEEP